MIQIDENDPCGTAAALRTAYANLIAGQAAARLVFRAGPNGVQREQEFHAADAGRLLALLRDYEGRCATAGGGRPRRFAVRGGGGTWPTI